LLDEVAPEEAIRETELPHLDLLPANRDLVGVEVEFVGFEGWEQSIRRVLTPVVDRYHTVLLDCPPSLGHLTVCALVAADGLLVPLQCEYFALEGISSLIATVERVQGSANPNLRIAGILLTMYDERTRLAKEVAEEVRRHFTDKVYQTVVPRNVRLAEAPGFGLPVLLYDIRSRGAAAYLALAREILGEAA
jgi:chromosome partitioning protein